MQRWGNPPHEAYTASARSRAIEPRKQQLERPKPSTRQQAAPEAPRQAWRPGSPEVEEHGDCTWGFAQEPGRPHLPPVQESRTGPPAQIRPRLAGARRVATRKSEKKTRPHGNPRAKETKPVIGEGKMGSRSALMVPAKRGNRSEGPRGGKRGVGRRNR